ncbi:MAG: hypothetical protein U1E05_02335, partial [Patescibacteria group bacterium]|nr:hypothetical protein [Patescibacteria group bacterium]
ERVLPLARKHNVGVVAMKVYGGAAGMKYQHLGPAQMPGRHIADAFRYALTLPGVATANIGANSIEEVRHNIRMAKEFQPLSDEQLANLSEQGKELAAEWGEHYGPVEEKA